MYLVGVDLDNNSLVHVGAVAIVVLLRVVGVNSAAERRHMCQSMTFPIREKLTAKGVVDLLGHVGTDQVTLGQSFQVGSL